MMVMMMAMTPSLKASRRPLVICGSAAVRPASQMESRKHEATETNTGWFVSRLSQATKCRRHPVKDVAPEPMSFGQCRMIEVVGRVVNHADALHHATRAKVVRHGERNNLGEPQ